MYGLESDCGAYFVQCNTTAMSSVVKYAMKNTQSKVSKGGTSTNILDGVDEGLWWLGRAQKMRKMVGSNWGMLKQPIDQMSRSVTTT